MFLVVFCNSYMMPRLLEIRTLEEVGADEED